MDRTGLADFLRVRRAGLLPADVGLPPGLRRRTAGLRREEVAALAGMSSDYYARLEQRRGPQPSEQVVAAIARALQLSPDERDHLFRLAGHPAPARFRRVEQVSPALLRVLERLEGSAALVISDLAETLVQNRLATALLGDQTGHRGLARSGFYRWFTDPAERSRYPSEGHPARSRSQAAALRAALSSAGADPRAGELVRALLRCSPEFAALWREHQVAHRMSQHKTVLHPEVGPIPLECQVLYSDNRAQALLVLTAAPGTEAARKLELLSVIGQQSFSS